MPLASGRSFGWPVVHVCCSVVAVRAWTTSSVQTFANLAWPIQTAANNCVSRRRCFGTTVATGASSSRWKARQKKDPFAREAKVQGLKSRAAFKLLEMDAKFRLFKSGQTVVDLGYAPGSWSQVAFERTKPSGRVVGIDIIPAQPPRGVSTIQGNFLSPTVQSMVKEFLLSLPKQRPSPTTKRQKSNGGDRDATESEVTAAASSDMDKSVVTERPSYIDMERQSSLSLEEETGTAFNDNDGRMVDVVLSDMSAPWPQTYGFWTNTLSNPYTRMMNTSGLSFRDHAGSMDLCDAALRFASETLRPGGHFVCKFYQGGEDKALENRLKKMFAKVHREKPESSRSHDLNRSQRKPILWP